MHNLRNRTIGILLSLGAAFLIYRTLTMLAEGALSHLVWWVNLLLIIELIIDIIALLVCLRWSVSLAAEHGTQVFRATAAVIWVHAIRVYIFALGRIGPWQDFDVRPEARAMHAERWSWGEVYFAVGMSTLSIALLIIYWVYRRKRFGSAA